MENKKFLPTVLTIFGATGDLMTRMIAPALLQLIKKELVPQNFKIIAFSRRSFTDDEYHNFLIREMFKLGSSSSNTDLSPLLEKISYHQGNFDDEQSYRSLSLRLAEHDTLWNICANKLFYLPIPPEYYQVVLGNIAASGLSAPCGPDEGWARVIVEKPFGKDTVTSQILDESLGKLFKEEQIYRSDHYLAKETVQNILSFRFSNAIFEPALTKKYISRIHVRLNETIGLDGRGDFYDGLGALRDVGANHLLQVAALLMMEPPKTFDAVSVRKARADFFNSLLIPSEKDIRDKTKRGQFHGYTNIEGVSKSSQTETYFCIELQSDSSRWKGVPIILEGGKMLEETTKDITLYYKNPPHSYVPPGEKDVEDSVRFDISDEEQLEVSLVFREPSHETTFKRNKIHYHTYGEEERKERIEEYELVLLDAIKGDQVRFISTDEIKAMWRVIDPIIEGWEAGLVPLETYGHECVV